VWRDPARAAEMGKRGAAGVRAHYTVAHMAQGVLAAYETALQKPQNRRPGDQVKTEC